MKSLETLVFIDTETTGSDAEKDRLCEVAYQIAHAHDEEVKFIPVVMMTQFKPPIPVSLEAMSVCHITNEMLEKRHPFEGSTMQDDLREFFENDAIFVAHNATFDIQILAHEGIKPKRVIDTLKVARAIDTEGACPNYKLQMLRYYFKLNVTGAAHNASDDVYTLAELFKHYHRSGVTIEQMLEISSKPSRILKITFGKYAGEKITDLAKKDRGYLEWLLGQKKKSPKGEEDWIFTIEEALYGPRML